MDGKLMVVATKMAIINQKNDGNFFFGMIIRNNSDIHL
jgi:hypothetical protein